MSLARLIVALALLAAVAGLGRPQPPASPAPPTDLADYVHKADPSFAWKLAGKTAADAGTVYEIDLVSQTWQGIVWDHKLQVFVPKDVKPQATMVLWNQGGRPNATSGLIGTEIAKKVGAPVAFLYGVPKQPLFDGKTEDALIAETFVRYLETKDGTWPLLFPMAKSVVRAMDALQAFARDEWKFEVKSFVVTGASKRGWTSWLTAASGDPRVKAIAPLVIDTLNMPAQMTNQVAAFGRPSDMIRDYTARKLVPIPDTPEAKKLWSMIDPWVYRDKLTLPKMIINGTNDPYWPLDALNSYWDNLQGDKFVLYVPNAGHDLREVGGGGAKELLPTRALNTLSAFCKCQIFDKPMPKLTWSHTDENGRPWVIVTPDQKPTAARMWFARSATRDFRKAQWQQTPTAGDLGAGRPIPYGAVRPADGFQAVLVEADFTIDGLTFTLSSQLRILDAKK